MQRLPVVVLGLVLALAVSLGPALAAPGPGNRSGAARAIATSAYCIDSEELAMLSLINTYRQDHGLVPLSPTQTLGAAAEHHSLDMAASDEFSHQLSDGTSWSDNMADHGYTYDTARGENIAAGNGHADATFEQWRNSPEHNANMLDPDFHAIGIGRAYNADSTYGWYWTTTFGGVADEGARACDAPAPDTGGETASATATTTSDLNLRGGPSLSDDVLLVIPDGSTVTVTGAATDGFVPVSYQGTDGWVSADYLDHDQPATGGDASGGAASGGAPTASSGGDTATTAADLNLRADPSLDGDILDVMPAGATVSLTGQSQDGFLSVSYRGETGWAHASYLDTGSGPSGDTATASERLNLRAGPSLSDDVVQVMPAGKIVALTGDRANGFVSVNVGGIIGWVYAAYLD